MYKVIRAEKSLKLSIWRAWFRQLFDQCCLNNWCKYTCIRAVCSRFISIMDAIFFIYPFVFRLVKFWTHWACKNIAVHWHAICLVAKRSVSQLHWNWLTIRQLCSSMSQHQVSIVQHVSNASVCSSFWLAAVVPSSVLSINHRPVCLKCLINCTHCPTVSAFTKEALNNWCHFWAHWIWNVRVTIIQPVTSLKWLAVNMETIPKN